MICHYPAYVWSDFIYRPSFLVFGAFVHHARVCVCACVYSWEVCSLLAPLLSRQLVMSARLLYSWQTDDIIDAVQCLGVRWTVQNHCVEGDRGKWWGREEKKRKGMWVCDLCMRGRLWRVQYHFYFGLILASCLKPNIWPYSWDEMTPPVYIMRVYTVCFCVCHAWHLMLFCKKLMFPKCQLSRDQQNQVCLKGIWQDWVSQSSKFVEYDLKWVGVARISHDSSDERRECIKGIV